MGDVDVLVVGGGPAGLAAALLAARAGHAVQLVEAADRLGGMAASIDVAGQRVDLGSHRLHPSASAPTMELLRALLGADLQVRERHGRLHLDGRWVGFPLRPGDLARSLPFPVAARIAWELLAGSRPDAGASSGGSYAAVVRDRLGPTVLERFHGPYARKLWDVPPDRLAGELARRRIALTGVRDVAARLVRASRPAGRTFLYPRHGYGQVVDALADAAVAAGVTITTSSRPTHLVPGPAGVRVTLAGGAAAVGGGLGGIGPGADRPRGAGGDGDRTVGSGGIGGRGGIDGDVGGGRDRGDGGRGGDGGDGGSGGHGGGSGSGGGGGGGGSGGDGGDGGSGGGAASDASEREDGHRVVVAGRVLWSAPPTALADAAGLAPVPLRHRGLALVYLVVDRPRWLEWDAHYVPTTGIAFHRLSEPKNYRDGPDPVDRTVLCAEVPCSAGDATWSMPDPDLAALVVDGIAALGLPAPPVVDHRVVRLPRVYPLLTVDDVDEVAAGLARVEDLPGVTVLGRQGLGVADNLHHVLDMARHAVACLGPDGSWDDDRWSRSRATFDDHVVED